MRWSSSAHSSRRSSIRRSARWLIDSSLAISSSSRLTSGPRRLGLESRLMRHPARVRLGSAWRRWSDGGRTLWPMGLVPALNALQKNSRAVAIEPLSGPCTLVRIEPLSAIHAPEPQSYPGGNYPWWFVRFDREACAIMAPVGWRAGVPMGNRQSGLATHRARDIRLCSLLFGVRLR